ncbi:hypothetical protein AB9E26_35330, partial [Rhizobium leguminosarum]
SVALAFRSRFLSPDILTALSSPSTCDGHVVFPAATIGGALAETETNPDQTRQNADVSLYHAKEHNRGRYVQHYPGLGIDPIFFQGDAHVPNRPEASGQGGAQA